MIGGGEGRLMEWLTWAFPGATMPPPECGESVTRSAEAVARANRLTELAHRLLEHEIALERELAARRRGED